MLLIKSNTNCAQNKKSSMKSAPVSDPSFCSRRWMGRIMVCIMRHTCLFPSQVGGQSRNNAGSIANATPSSSGYPTSVYILLAVMVNLKLGEERDSLLDIYRTGEAFLGAPLTLPLGVSSASSFHDSQLVLRKTKKLRRRASLFQIQFEKGFYSNLC